MTLTGYMKSQISFDEVSKASTGTVNVQNVLNNNSEIKPDFKKKKKEESVEKADISNSKSSNVIKSSSNQNLQVEHKTAKSLKQNEGAVSGINANAQKVQYLKL